MGHKNKVNRTSTSNPNTSVNINQDESYRKSKNKKSDYYLANDPSAAEFRAQLNKLGLDLRGIPSDGNCLFASLSDQLYGTFVKHRQVREQAITYIESHKDDFEPFFDVDQQLRSLRTLGTYGGQESIIAIARSSSVFIVVHQLNQKPWLAGTPKIDIPDEKVQNYNQLHLAYHNGEHYSSVRVLGDTSNDPTNIKIRLSDPVPFPRSTKSKSLKASGTSHHKNSVYLDDDFPSSSYSPKKADYSESDDTSLNSSVTKSTSRKLKKLEKRLQRKQSKNTEIPKMKSDTEYVVESLKALHM